MGVFQNNLMGAAAAAASAGGGDFYSHQIANSLRNSDSQNGTLKFTAGTPTSGTTFTFSYWVKRYDNETDSGKLNIFVTGTGGGTYVIIGFKNNTFTAEFTGGTYGDTRLITDAVYRDTSAWYHHVMRFDSTQASASNRLRLYVNGVEPSYSSATVQSAISQDEDWDFINESGVVQAFGGLSGKGHGTEGADLQMAEIVFCDGQSYGPDSFGETKNGVWIPKDPSGLTFGNNGYYLKFESSSDLGNDSSGNNNDFTAANLAAHDQMLDTPTFNSNSNGGNYCTLNPLFPDPTVARINDGMLAWGGSGGGGSVNEMGCMSTFAISPSDTNKYYFEARMKTGTSGGIEQAVGVNVPTVDLTSDRGGRPTAWCISNNDNQRIYNGANSYTETGVGGSAGDIVGVEIDRANTTIKFYVNGTLRGTQTNLNTTTDLYPWVGTGGSTSDALGWDMNFGQNGTFNGLVTAQGETDATGYGNFYYDEAGSGKALCTGNLPVAAEVDPAQTDDDYPQKLFGTLKYTGNGSERTIDTGFQIDWLWSRMWQYSQNWYIWDTSRGLFGASSNNYYIRWDAEGGQATAPQYNYKAQSGSSYTLTGGTWFNSGSSGYQNWFWRLNGGTTAANTDGSVNSTVQVDPSGCFSITTYQAGLTSSGTVTVGHGLSKAPKFLIHTAYGSGVTGQRWVRSSGLTNWSYAIQLTSNNAQQDKSNNGNMDVAPTSSVFTVNYTEGLGDGSADNITYAFADCEGYIKSGKFIGNADADGTFIYLGFKPAFFWIIHAASGDDPQVWDLSNGNYNPMTKTLSTHTNSAQVDNANRSVDFLSNGVKIRSSNSNVNSSNAAGIIYLAMAHNPFKYATAR